MEDVNKPRRIFLAPSKLECGSQEISSREIRLHLTFLVDWNQPRSQALSLATERRVGEHPGNEVELD